jgi:hypothetical protein
MFYRWLLLSYGYPTIKDKYRDRPHANLSKDTSHRAEIRDAQVHSKSETPPPSKRIHNHAQTKQKDDLQLALSPIHTPHPQDLVQILAPHDNARPHYRAGPPFRKT